MEIGDIVETLVDKNTNEGKYKVYIPKGSFGLICEIHDSWAFVELKTKDLPEGMGLFDYDLKELKARDGINTK